MFYGQWCQMQLLYRASLMFDAVIPSYLVSLLFGDLLSLHLVSYVPFLAAGAWLSWSLPSKTEQQSFLSRCKYWLKNHWPQALSQQWLLKTLHFSIHTTVFLIQQFGIVIVSLLSDLCTWIQVFENGIANEAIDLRCPVRTALWDLKKRWAGALLRVKFCVKTIVKESRNFELEEEKEEDWWLSDSVLLWCFFVLGGVL